MSMIWTPLVIAIGFSIAGFIAIFGKNRADRFEYVWESFEYILLIAAPLIVAASFVENQEMKTYFLIAHIGAMIVWFLFWIFVKKWGSTDSDEQEKTRLAKYFTIGAFVAFIGIGCAIFRL